MCISPNHNALAELTGLQVGRETLITHDRAKGGELTWDMGGRSSNGGCVEVYKPNNAKFLVMYIHMVTL